MEHTAACVRFSVQSASSSPACPQRKGMRRMSIMNVAGYSVFILSRSCLRVEDVLLIAPLKFGWAWTFVQVSVVVCLACILEL